jgi:hypothetical protein
MQFTHEFITKVNCNVTVHCVILDALKDIAEGDAKCVLNPGSLHIIEHSKTHLAHHFIIIFFLRNIIKPTECGIFRAPPYGWCPIVISLSVRASVPNEVFRGVFLHRFI